MLNLIEEGNCYTRFTFKPNPVHSLNLLNTVAALIAGIVDLC